MSRWVDAGHALLAAPHDDVRCTGISGAVGDALFACAFDAGEPAAGHAWLSRAIDDLETNGGPASLHGGFAGLGLVVAMYRTDAEEFLVGLDKVLVEQLAPLPPSSMQSGVAGIALYASVRSHAPSGRALQRAVVDALRDGSTDSAVGRVWPTPAAYARSRGVDVLGEPVTEYGVLHGVGGALVGLAALVAQGDAEAAALLRDGLDAAWSYARETPNRFGRILFGHDGVLGTHEFGKPRWCVGDAGVLRALWIAARALGDTASAARALDEMRADAVRDARSQEASPGGEINLCCGWGAVAQTYLRMHRETGEDVFLRANRALLARCEARFDSHAEASFAYGTRGVVLALLAAERAEDPSWDAMLGMSLPARASR